MDNVQKVCHFNNTSSSQTFRIYLQWCIKHCLESSMKHFYVSILTVFLMGVRVFGEESDQWPYPPGRSGRRHEFCLDILFNDGDRNLAEKNHVQNCETKCTWVRCWTCYILWEKAVWRSLPVGYRSDAVFRAYLLLFIAVSCATFLLWRHLVTSLACKNHPLSRNYVFFVREETGIVKEGIVFQNTVQSGFLLSPRATSLYNET
jgi:hypothetical protein